MAREIMAPPPCVAHFAAVERELQARGPEALRALRRRGLATFERLGLPTTALEEWKTTRITRLAETDFRPAPRPATTPSLRDLPEIAGLDLGGPRLVFLDGHYLDGLSRPSTIPAGVSISSLDSALEQDPQRVTALFEAIERSEPASAFHALNTALFHDGAWVSIPPGLELAAPVQLLYLSSGKAAPTATHVRTIVSVGRGARVSLVEAYVGLGDEPYWTNAVTQVVVGQDASLRHDLIQLESARAFHISDETYRQERASVLESCRVDLGGRLVRHDLTAVLDGEGADCRLNGLYATAGDQHVDNHTVLDHARPQGTSREVYKGVLTGSSRAVFNGKIVVRQDAQRTNAKQSNPNLLLSDRALAHTRPQLEIHADDVKCTHGATIGQLDADALFYLRSRGLDRQQARRLLIHAFAAEILDAIPCEALRQGLWRGVAERLAADDV
jgi:Fe-S cluster assembly protein SufD